MVGAFIVTGALVLNLLGSCGTSTGNPPSVILEFKPYNSGSAFNILPLLLIRPAYAAVSSVTFCFKRLRFKLDDENTSDVDNDKNNINFEIGKVTLSENGTALGTRTLSAGTYRRIEFDLDNKCDNKRSVEITRNGNTFSTTSRITIKFKGTFTLEDTGRTVELAVQALLDALNSVTSDGDIKDKLENSVGSY